MNKISLSKKLDQISVSNVTGQQKSSNHTKFKTFNFDRKVGLKYTMPLCHFDSYNLWILKPTHLNRGRGIHVFRDLDSLHKLIKQYCSGKTLDKFKQKNKEKPN